MAALIEAAKAPGFPAEIVLVISNKASAPGLEIAAREHIPTLVINHRKYVDRASFDLAMTVRMEAAGVDIVCLAGFMRLLSPEFCQQWAGKLINVHPALLPSFKGLDTHARAIAAGVKLHGATVHFVTPEMDEGPIIAQAAVPVLDGDSEADLGARVLTQEHVIYPLALRMVALGQISIRDGRTWCDAQLAAPQALVSPHVADGPEA